MRSLALAFLLALPFSAETLATKYDTARALRVEIVTSSSQATTSMEMEIDGERVEPRGGMSSETTYKETHVDHVLAADGGKPTKVRRKFVEVGAEGSMEFGDDSRDLEYESAFDGIEIEIEAGEGDAVDVKVVEGSAPDEDGALEGQRLDSFLDGLLPDAAVEPEGTWDLEKDAIVRALRLDLRSKLFVMKMPETGGGEEGGGNRRGNRPQSQSRLAELDWKGTAKLAKGTDEVDGVECVVVELQLEASGERELPAMGGGRRERMLGLPLENTEKTEVKAEGKLWFSTKEARPVKLEVEGKVRSERRSERTTQRGTMKSSQVNEGKLEMTVEVSVEKADEAKAAEAKAEKKD